MKPKNFPERKNKRRKVALINMQMSPGKKQTTDDKQKEHAILQSRVKNSTRDQRSKINRSM